MKTGLHTTELLSQRNASSQFMEILPTNPADGFFFVQNMWDFATFDTFLGHLQAEVACSSQIPLFFNLLVGKRGAGLW